MLKAYKYRIYPNDKQKEQLKVFFGSCRFVFNLALETKINSYKNYKKNITYFDLNKQLTDLKNNEAKWLKDCPSQSLQMSLLNLDNSYKLFFKGNGFPKFKNKYSRQTIQLPQGVSVDFHKNIVRLPKLKNVSAIFDRKFEGKIKTVTVSKTTTDKYFVSILVENQDLIPDKKPIIEDTSVGIDMGVKTFATLSDGTSFENIKSLRSNLKRLRVEQRSLVRKRVKGKEQSKRYQKQKLVVSKLYEKIYNQRTDYLHKVSTSIIRKYDTIVLEDLNIKGMMSNHKLAQSIGDIGWNKFELMLKYKAEWYGKNLIYIGRFEPSSKICSNCGTINKDLKLNDRNWNCIYCNSNHDRDFNASINIKKFGLRDKPSIVKVSH